MDAGLEGPGGWDSAHREKGTDTEGSRWLNPAERTQALEGAAPRQEHAGRRVKTRETDWWGDLPSSSNAHKEFSNISKRPASLTLHSHLCPILSATSHLRNMRLASRHPVYPGGFCTGEGGKHGSLHPRNAPPQRPLENRFTENEPRSMTRSSCQAILETLLPASSESCYCLPPLLFLPHSQEFSISATWTKSLL